MMDETFNAVSIKHLTNLNVRVKKKMAANAIHRLRLWRPFLTGLGFEMQGPDKSGDPRSRKPQRCGR
jgi:hypothetical protein